MFIYSSKISVTGAPWLWFPLRKYKVCSQFGKFPA